MRRFRISIATALSGVLILARGLASIRVGSRPWMLAVVSATVIFKTAAIAGAIVARGRSRAFWVGFALFGWQFLGSPALPGSSGAQAMAAQEFANAGAVALHPYAESFVPLETTTGSPDSPPPTDLADVSYDIKRRVYLYDREHRARNSAASLMAVANLIYATLGGLISLALASSRPSDPGTEVHR